MCGRFTLKAPPEDLAAAFGIDEPLDLEARYNIAPTQEVAVVRRDPRDEKRHLAMLRWGLIPPWAKDPAIGGRLINARSETAADKPSFRDALRFRRGLILADGFYEWQRRGKRKQPLHIRLAGGEPFGFAGLWERWRAPEGHTVETCTILTTTPNELVRPIHDRMPVILPPEDHARWLDPGADEPATVLPLLRPFPAEGMTAYPVSPAVNAPANEGPELVEPFAVPESDDPQPGLF